MSATADRPGAGGGKRGLEVRGQPGSHDSPLHASSQYVDVVRHEGFIVIKEFKGIETCLFYKIWKLQKRKSMAQRKFPGHVTGNILLVCGPKDWK